VSPETWLDWHDNNTAFSQMAAYAGGSKILEAPNIAERLEPRNICMIVDWHDGIGLLLADLKTRELEKLRDTSDGCPDRRA
jgi:hypothetical protein